MTQIHMSGKETSSSNIDKRFNIRVSGRSYNRLNNFNNKIHSQWSFTVP